MSIDWNVYEGSRIARLPFLLRRPAILMRAIARGTLDRVAPLREHHHRFDGITTRHNDGFRRNPGFQKAASRATQAAGREYPIPYRLHQLLWCAHQAAKIDGDFVELGTGRGFMMSAVLERFEGWAESGRRMHLFDTFLPSMPDILGKQDGPIISPYYASSSSAVRDNFAEWERVIFHEGDVYDTLPKADLAKIALLHLDLNFHEPEIFGLNRIWPLIPRGGVVLFDDYAHAQYGKTFDAVNQLSRDLGFEVLSTPTGQGIIIK